jgi:hypothetical protein
VKIKKVREGRWGKREAGCELTKILFREVVIGALDSHLSYKDSLEFDDVSVGLGWHYFLIRSTGVNIFYLGIFNGATQTDQKRHFASAWTKNALQELDAK